MTAVYDTTEGDKQRARELLIHHVRKFIPDPVTCFLMPGVTAHDAMLVKKEFANIRIMCVERERKEFNKIEQLHRWLTIFNSSVRDYIKDHATGHVKIDFAFLDYFSEYNNDRQEEISDMVEYFLKPNSILALTFQKAARQDGAEKRDSTIAANAFLEWTYTDGTDEEWTKEKANTVFNIANTVLSRLAENRLLKKRQHRYFDILEVFEYKANEASTTMYFMILKIETI